MSKALQDTDRFYCPARACRCCQDLFLRASLMFPEHRRRQDEQTPPDWSAIIASLEFPLTHTHTVYIHPETWWYTLSYGGKSCDAWLIQDLPQNVVNQGETPEVWGERRGVLKVFHAENLLRKKNTSWSSWSLIAVFLNLSWQALKKQGQTFCYSFIFICFHMSELRDSLFYSLCIFIENDLKPPRWDDCFRTVFDSFRTTAQCVSAISQQLLLFNVIIKKT